MAKQKLQPKKLPKLIEEIGTPPKGTGRAPVLEEVSDLAQFELDIHSFLDDRNYLKEMDDDKRKVFLGGASAIFQNPVFEEVVNELMNIQASHSILQAPTSQLIMFDRAGINVLHLLKNEFKKLDSIYKDSVKPLEEYDQDEVI